MLTVRLIKHRAWRMVPRIPELKKLEGWYSLGRKLPLYEEYLASQSKLKFSRWLKDKKSLSDNVIAAVCKAQAESTQQVKVSCRYNDILRMSDNPSFHACTSSNRQFKYVPARILLDPNAAIVFAPDAAGHFKGRAIILMQYSTHYFVDRTELRTVQYPSKEISIMRCYGTLNLKDLTSLFLGLGYVVSPHQEDAAFYYGMKRPNYPKQGYRIE